MPVHVARTSELLNYDTKYNKGYVKYFVTYYSTFKLKEKYYSKKLKKIKRYVWNNQVLEDINIIYY